MSFDLIHARISAVEYKLEECKQQAAELRKNHLDSRLERAKELNDEDAIKAIERIIKKENNQRDWGVARMVHGKKRGRNVLTVEVKNADGTVTTCNTRDSVEDAAANELNPRFRLSASAPIFNSPLIDYVGMMGEKPAVKQILDGTFEYPADCDRFLRTTLLAV
jgi:hypothetical protein